MKTTRAAAAFLLSVCASTVLAQSIPSYEDKRPDLSVQAVKTPVAVVPYDALTASESLVPARQQAPEKLQAIEQWNADGHKPARHGFEREFDLPLRIDLASDVLGATAGGNTVAVQQIPTGIVWTRKFEVENASEFRLRLSNVKLPANSEIYVTGRDGLLRGPVGLNLLTGDGDLWTPSVESDIALLYVLLPGTTAEQPGYGFDVVGVVENFDLDENGFVKANNDGVTTHAAACLVDATCASWSFRQSAQLAVARLSFVEGQFSYLCTGGLLADTTNSQTPYLLTADHCGLGSQSVASTLQAGFDYKSASCNGGAGIAAVVNGATVRATSALSDFTLLQLPSVPAGRVFYGWDAAPATVGEDTVLFRVSHPGGLPQKYSESEVVIANIAYLCGDAPPSSFIYSTPTYGTTEGGSSGAPVLASSGGTFKVVGQLLGLCGDDIPCSYSSYNTLDGAFSTSYQSICQWLDPNGTATITAPTLWGDSASTSGQPFFLGWNDTSASSTYEVQYATTSNFTNPVTMNVTGAGGTEFVAVGNQLTTYYYRVRAKFTCSGNGNTSFSNWSNTHQVVIAPGQCYSTTPAPLVTVQPSVVHSGEAYEVTWGHTSTSNQYEFQESTNANFSGAPVQLLTSTRFETAHTVNAVTTYYYRVRTLQTCMPAYEKPWSTVKSVIVYPGNSAVLTKGVPVTGIHGALDSLRYYSINVPAGSTNLRIEIFGGTGDADLYVRRGAAPTFNLWDARPYQTGNFEEVFFANPTSGTWHVMLHGYEPYDGVTLLATYDRNVSIGDFNADGKSDLVWRNIGSGSTLVWLMNGTSYAGQATLPSVSSPTWTVAGTGDFNGDAKPDMVWRNSSTFRTVVWLLNGTTYVDEAVLPGVSSSAWRIAGIGDFNSDGDSDLVWQNSTTFQTVVWLMDGTTYLGEAALPSVSSAQWSIRGVGDFNGDGSADLVWRNSSTFQTVVWLMNGTTYLGEASLPGVSSAAWNIDAIGDYNDDDSPDLVWRNSSTLQTVVWMLNGTTYLGESNVPGALNGSWLVVGPK